MNMAVTPTSPKLGERHDAPREELIDDIYGGPECFRKQEKVHVNEPVDEGFSLMPSKVGLFINVVGVGLNVVLPLYNKHSVDKTRAGKL